MQNKVIVKPEDCVDATEGKVLIVGKTQEKQKTVICEVCGYANSENVALCKMCSNYLKEKQ